MGGFGLPHIGIGGLLILLVLSLAFHRNFFALLGGGLLSNDSTQVRPVNDTAEEPEVHFSSFVLDDAQRTWEQIFQKQGRAYRHAKVVLFRDAVDSACGMAQSATGPFYCPEDEKVYIDLSFYDELKQRFGAPGDFAQAYVLAHEIGHHVQKLLRIESEVQRAGGRIPASGINCQYDWSCRRTAWLAYGVIPPSSAISWRQATLRMHCAQLQQ